MFVVIDFLESSAKHALARQIVVKLEITLLLSREEIIADIINYY